MITSPEHEQKREEMARARLRKEVELEGGKRLLDEQARLLLRTNYVCKSDAVYRSDLVESLPDGSAVPPCIRACAVFVRVSARATSPRPRKVRRKERRRVRAAGPERA